MNIKQQFEQQLKNAEKVLGVDLTQEEQGGYEWLRAKLGVISASNASKVLSKTGSMTRDGYMAELIGEIATQAPLDGAQPSGKAIEWGNENEAPARETFQFMSGAAVDTFPFVYAADMRVGCSPDGLILAEGKGLEIKCPWNTRYHIEFLVDGRIKKEYMDQVQFSMWVTGMSQWEFCSFDPRMKEGLIKHMTVERSDKHMELFNNAVPEFIKEMDRKLSILGLKFGYQWQ